MRIGHYEKRTICEWIRADHSDDVEVQALPDELLLTLHPEYEEVGPYPKSYTELSERLIQVAQTPEAEALFNGFLESFPSILTNEYVITAALKKVGTLAKEYGMRGNGIDWLTSLLKNTAQADYLNSYSAFLEAGSVPRYDGYARLIYCSIVDEKLGGSLFTPRELEQIKLSYQRLTAQLVTSNELVSSM